MTMSRRDFVRSVTAAGASMAMAGRATTASAEGVRKPAADDLNIALIGAGLEGQVLVDSCLKIPGIRFKAICDIWPYKRDAMFNRLTRTHKHDVTAYEDYRELLAQEEDVDAVVIATPDWLHAEHTNACLENGWHVYCEKEMSNSLEKAKSMVHTAKKTGKLLQIGHQRRSNPRYQHGVDRLIHELKLLGRVTHANAQWNRSKSAATDICVNQRIFLSPESLTKYGYDTMSRFLNWRWYKKFGGGPIVDLGSHQIDIFAWVFGCNPKSVIASGGVDFYKHHEWYDNVLCIFEYENEEGTARAFYETLTTSGHGGFSEAFMGEYGTLLISEVPGQGNSAGRQPADAPEWDKYIKTGDLMPIKAPPKKVVTKNVLMDSRVSPGLPKWPLPIELAKPVHQLHLENFFNAIRFGEPLNCPAEVGYETAVAVLACNDAVATNRRIEFKETDFIA
ncbi:MAG: Gfo/Idh/MocA family oxidoreductase [Kiritimatiellae bacterium]|nr:Gfo/Idh/MocA family oxidoreductase [Kiritimatiellia bacterium]